MKQFRSKINSTSQPRFKKTAAQTFLAFLFVILLIISWTMPHHHAVYANTPPEGEPVNLIGHTNSGNGSALRSEPHIDSLTFIVHLAQGTKLEVVSKVTGDSWNSSDQWFYVRDIAGNRYGYVHEKLVTLTDTPINQSPPGPDAEFDQYLASQNFPESYKPALRQLHHIHPQWKFIAFHVKDVASPAPNRLPLSFAKALDEESKPKRNMVNRTAILSHRSYEKADYDFRTDTWTVYDAGGWMGASRAIIAYSMDPRNFLDEAQIFQFEQLTYHPEAHPISGVEAAITGTFMAGKTVTFTDLDGNEQTMTYPEIFMDAASRMGVNPFFLVQRCLTEVGRNGSDSVSGTVSGYEGYYNFYNIGASAGSNPILNGLKYARYGSSGSGPTDNERQRYKLPWVSPWHAIVGGAAWIGEGYILAGQDNSYLQKFNIDGGTYGTYWHQYMGNVYAPSIEATRVYDMYRTQGLLDMPFAFKIPVMTGMPATFSPYPSGKLSCNNWLKSITLSEGALSPAFDPEVYTYNIAGETGGTLTVSAAPYHSGCTVTGTGAKTLQPGSNTIVLNAVSASGHTRQYTMTLTYAPTTPTDPTTTTPTTTPTTQLTTPTTQPTTTPTSPSFTLELSDGYKIKNNFLMNAWPPDGRNKAGRILTSLTLPAGYSAKIFDASGNVATQDTLLGTGARIDIFYESENTPTRTLWLVIYGDANGDGKINSIDLSYIIDSMYKGKRWTPAQNEALDASRDGKINSIDLSIVIDQMYKGRVIRQD